jgi:hypothetical protein
MSASDDADEAQAAADALEETLFYGDGQGAALFDESSKNWEDEADDWEAW